MRVAVPVRARPIAIVLLSAIALAACGEPPPPDLSGSRAVTFESRDGVTLEGRLFGDGSTGVVLSHMRPADQRSWFAFANRLADEGYLVLTYDFRGYCPGGEGGCSQEISRSRRSGRTCWERWTSCGPRGDDRRARGREHGRHGLARRGRSGGNGRGRGGDPLGTDVDRGARRRRRPASTRGREQAVHRGCGDAAAARRPSSSTRSPHRRKRPPRSSPPTTTAPTC